MISNLLHMKAQYFIILIIIGSVFAACLKVDPLPTPTSSSIKGTWKAIAFNDFVLDTTFVRNPDSLLADRDVVVVFDESVFPFEIKGANPPNTFEGNYAYVELDKIEISNLRLSIVRASLPPWSQYFGDAIEMEWDEFILEDDELTIFYDQRRKSMVLEKE